MKREIAQINDNPEIQIEEHAAKRLKSDLSELTFLDAPALEIKELIKKNDPELIAQKFDTVEKLLTKYNVKITDVYNLESINVLQVLAYIGSTEIIRKLLDRHLGTEVINSQTDGEVNATPLMFAAKKGHKEVVELLLDRGADIEYVVKSNNEGWNGVNLLHLAAANNRNEIIEHLHTKHQSKFKELVNKPKHDGFTPILLAVFNGHINSVEALIKSGADIEYVIKNNNQGWNDANLLHLAAFDDRKEIIEYLYKDHKDKFKKLVNKPKDDGYTPIFHAVIGGHKNSLEALIKSGADIEYVIKNNNQGWNGANILHLAAFHNKNEIIEHLHTNHASMLKELVNIPLHYYGLTPIFQAVIEGHKNSVEALIKSGADIEYVIKNNNQGWNDANLLHLAAFHDRKEIIEYLYKDHKDKFKKLVNKPSHGWCTPIFQAVIEGHKNSVEALIKSGADIDCKLPNGKTLSSFATERGHTEIVKLIETYKFAKSAAEKECDITTIQNAINTDKIQIDKFIDFLNFFIEKTSSTYAKALIVENNNSFKDVADLIWKHSLSKQYKELKTEKLCSLLGISSRLEVLKNSNATDEQSELLSELPEGLKEYIDNPEALVKAYFAKDSTLPSINFIEPYAMNEVEWQMFCEPLQRLILPKELKQSTNEYIAQCNAIITDPKAKAINESHLMMIERLEQVDALKSKNEELEKKILEHDIIMKEAATLAKENHELKEEMSVIKKQNCIFFSVLKKLLADKNQEANSDFEDLKAIFPQSPETDQKPMDIIGDSSLDYS